VTSLFEPSLPGRPGASPAPVEGDGEWLRVHPLTPLIKFWQGIVVLLLVSFRDLQWRRRRFVIAVISDGWIQTTIVC